MFQFILRALLSISMFAFSLSVYAQSVQVFGGSTSARNCYMAATIAAQMQIGTREDIKECTYALEKTSLPFRDRLATYINRGIIYVAKGEFDAAIRDYDRAYRMDPDVAELHVSRGNMFYMGERYDQAVDEYSRALELEFNKQHVAYYNRGMAWEKLGELDKAEADYRKSIELSPDWYPPQNKLQRMLTRLARQDNT